MNKPKSINEIVGKLRANGELDEGKWANYKTHEMMIKYIGYLAIFLLLIVVFVTDDSIIMKIVYILFVLIASYFLSKSIPKDRRRSFRLYNSGILVNGKVMKYEDGHYCGCAPVSRVFFSFSDSGGTKYENCDFIEREYGKSLDFRESGKINILYDEQDPSDNTIYDHNLFNKYNVKTNHNKEN